MRKAKRRTVHVATVSEKPPSKICMSKKRSAAVEIPSQDFAGHLVSRNVGTRVVTGGNDLHVLSRFVCPQDRQGGDRPRYERA